MYKHLPLYQLLVGVPTEFDLYVQYANQKKVLFSHAGHIFTSANKEHLIESGNKYLYIKDDDYKNIKQYRAKNFTKLLKNTDLTSDERAELLHESVNDQMYHMFEYGISETAIASSKVYIKAIVDEMMGNRIHSESLLRLTAHDYETYSHSVNVAIYALSLGQELGLSQREMIQLGSGALLHDLGKSKISFNIINKPGKLTIKEFQEMKKHPDLGYDILKSMGETDQAILDIVKYHHEKLDGSGYGLGLTRDSIRSEIQIVTVADIFDALTTNRSYKLATTHFSSFKTMKVMMKDKINMKYVDHLIRLMGKVK